MAKETAKGLAGILKPEQEKRYKQISLQAQGARAFQDPEVQKQLKLTDDQKASLKTIMEDAAKEQQELRQGAQGGNRQEAGQKMAALRKETMEKAQNVLTDAQKTTWKDVIGKPFAIKFERPGGPRRGAA
jgi:hypothetical protein